MYEFKDSHNEVQYSFICMSACISMLTCAPNGCKRNRKNEEKFVRRAQNSGMRYCEVVTKIISLFTNQAAYIKQLEKNLELQLHK